MKWEEFNAAIADAKRTITMTDSVVADMARIIQGRLRKSNVSHYVLTELKKELQKWNMHTKTWNEE